MADLTPEQRKAFVEAVTAINGGWVDAFENYFESDRQEMEAEKIFLAGVRWAQKEKR